EVDPIRDPGLPRVRARRLQRLFVRVEADEAGPLERRRHEDRRVPVAGADVGDARTPLQLLDDAVERGEPLRDERGAIRVAVEDRHAAVETLVVVAPGNAVARSERVEHPLLIEPERGSRTPAAGRPGSRRPPAPARARAAARTSRTPGGTRGSPPLPAS